MTQHLRDEPLISLIFPCFCPYEKQWDKLCEFINRLNLETTMPIEYIVVDDGSSFWVEPQKLKEICKIIRLKENKGKGAALKEALKSTSPASQVFAFIDFDLPYSLEDLLKVISLVISNNADVAVGNRKAWWKKTKIHTGSRSLSHSIFRFVTRFFLGEMCDSQCGIKAFKTKVARIIASYSQLEGFLYDLEWLFIAQHHLLNIQHVPVEIQDDHEATSLRHFFKFRELRDFIVLFFNAIRNKYSIDELIGWKIEDLKEQSRFTRKTSRTLIADRSTSSPLTKPLDL